MMMAGGRCISSSSRESAAQRQEPPGAAIAAERADGHELVVAATDVALALEGGDAVEQPPPASTNTHSQHRDHKSHKRNATGKNKLAEQTGSVFGAPRGDDGAAAREEKPDDGEADDESALPDPADRAVFTAYTKMIAAEHKLAKQIGSFFGALHGDDGAAAREEDPDDGEANDEADGECALPDPADRAAFTAYTEMITARECIAVVARRAELTQAVEHLEVEPHPSSTPLSALFVPRSSFLSPLCASMSRTRPAVSRRTIRDSGGSSRVRKSAEGLNSARPSSA